MFTNTGSLSFYLGISFIALALVGFIATSFLVLRTQVESNKIDKLVEVGKWFIVSVAIVVGATIVSDGFREREQDIKEVEVFDKHVATIIKADGIEERWLLAEYFSFVAPPGELRSSWASYKDSLLPRLEEYRTDKAEKERLAKIEQPSSEQKEKLSQLQVKTAPQERPLISQMAQVLLPSQEWAIIAGADASLEAAQFELGKARTLSPAARIYKKGTLFQTVIPGFSRREDAANRLGDVKKSVNADAYINSLSSWCASFNDRGDFIECN